MSEITQHKFNISKNIINSFYKGEEKIKYVAGAIFKDGKVLLGISTAKDKRKGKLCFPGGNIEKDETISNAVKREIKQESGINVDLIRGFTPSEENHNLIYIRGLYKEGEIKPNLEFSDMDWYSTKDLPEDKIYPENLTNIKKWMK